MESVHQIITVKFLIISLLLREIHCWYKNIWAGIKRIEYKLLNHRLDKEQYKSYLPGGIYQ